MQVVVTVVAFYGLELVVLREMQTGTEEKGIPEPAIYLLEKCNDLDM